MIITGNLESRHNIIGKLQHLNITKLVAHFTYLVLVMALAGCKTMKNRPEVQENTTALKAVSDSQYILRLAPYTSETDSSAFVFEVCKINSPNDGCAIAFLSSTRQPVIFTVREISRHRQSTAEALAKFVQDNPELVGAISSAAAAPVTYEVGTKLTAPETSFAMKVEVMEMMESQGLKSIKELQTRKNMLAERFGLEIDRIQLFDTDDGKMEIPKQTKLRAFLDSQDSFTPHVFKQDFVDFLKAEYSKELLANNTTAEQVLRWPSLQGHRFDNMDALWDELVQKYRTKLRDGRALLDSEKSYQSVIDDLIDPSLTDAFNKYNNLIQVAEDINANRLDALQEALEKPLLTRFEVHKGWKPFTLRRMGYLQSENKNSQAISHINVFQNNILPDEITNNRFLQETVHLNFAIQNHLPNKDAFKAAKKQLDELGMTPGQALKKWGGNKRLVRRVSVFFVMIAGALTGVAGAKKVFGIGSDVNKEEGVALRHPSLFEVDANTSPVDTVQGIVLQLGEYLNKSGVDIDYYCMPAGCQLLY